MKKHLPKNSLIVFLIFISFLVKAQEKPYVIMISLDGFRWDYPTMVTCPTLDSLASVGVKAGSLRPSFPSVTFPNHYTMATGMYPDHHGIVANNFYDPLIKKSYNMHTRTSVEDASFYGGEPIWVTAEKQGITTATFYWVGSEALINNMHPTIWKKYDETIPFTARTDTVIAWLSLPEKQRPHLILFYFHEPDNSGHRYGPASNEVKSTITGLDRDLRDLFRKFKMLPLAGQLNVIVTADHGMQSSARERSVVLTNHVLMEHFEIIEGYSPVLLFKVKPEFDSLAFLSLKNIPHCQVWRSRETPRSLHYGANPRTLDYVLLADSGWFIRKKPESNVPRGSHGYDPFIRDMHAIFYASGPAFKKNFTIPQFENTDLYLIIARILDLTPAPGDGDLSRVSEIFIRESHK